jgi:iron complex transport system substrate-binding protein
MARSRSSCAALCCFLAAVSLVGCRQKPSKKPARAVVGSPRRIVTIAPNAAEIISTLGAADRLVAVSQFCKYPPDLASLPRVGGLINPNLEAILALEPDLVILGGRCREIERLCESHGIAFHNDPTECLEDVFSKISTLGEIVERQAAARRLAGGMRRRLDAITAATRECPRPRVLFVTGRAATSLAGVTTAGKDTFVSDMIERAGGVNVFGHLDVRYPQVSLEDILTAQPEVIIEAMPGENSNDALREEARRQWSRIGPMPATRADRVYVVTESHLLIPSPRVVESIAIIARLLHPEIEID